MHVCMHVPGYDVDPTLRLRYRVQLHRNRWWVHQRRRFAERLILSHGAAEYWLMQAES